MNFDREFDEARQERIERLKRVRRIERLKELSEVLLETINDMEAEDAEAEMEARDG